jgi:hypothetical protein
MPIRMLIQEVYTILCGKKGGQMHATRKPKPKRHQEPQAGK